MLPEPALETPSEQAQVEAWRARELLAAGYPQDTALELAARTDVDLHHAVDLIRRRGCPPELAARILT